MLLLFFVVTCEQYYYILIHFSAKTDPASHEATCATEQVQYTQKSWPYFLLCKGYTCLHVGGDGIGIKVDILQNQCGPMSIIYM